MSCVREPALFRLLHAIVGWDPLDVTGLEGFDDAVAGVALARLSPDAVDPSDLLPFLPPARLAPGCGRCDSARCPPCSRRRCCRAGSGPG